MATRQRIRRIADLFCCAGGSAEGLHMVFPDAEIVGVDIRPQPRYPFTFVQANATKFDLYRFDLLWGSPPCQRYSPMRYQDPPERHAQHRHLIPAVQRRFRATGKPYIIENVPTAAQYLRNPFMLCGTYFDLGVFRHRFFETNFPVETPEHTPHQGKVGDGKYHTVVGHAGGSSRRDGWKGGTVADWREAMGIDWMVGDELAEAIPPAYAWFIGTAYVNSL